MISMLFVLVDPPFKSLNIWSYIMCLYLLVETVTVMNQSIIAGFEDGYMHRTEYVEISIRTTISCWVELTHLYFLGEIVSKIVIRKLSSLSLGSTELEKM